MSMEMRINFLEVEGDTQLIIRKINQVLKVTQRMTPQ